MTTTTVTNPSNAITVQSISLFMTEGSSDKEYHVQLLQTEGGYLVNMQNGRRGGTLTPRTKTPTPIDLTLAQKTFDSLVMSKKKDGYTEAPDGKAFSMSTQDFTGIIPQLLNPITVEQSDAYLLDDQWCAQEKHDGHRRMMRSLDNSTNTQSINRKGISTGLPTETEQALLPLHAFAPFLIDGELIGSHYYIFDVLHWKGKDLTTLPLSERLDTLDTLRSVFNDQPLIHITTTARTVEQKRALFETLRQQHREGIVFKKLAAPHNTSRPASGGNALKCKFVKTATVRVKSAQKTKRSVNIQIMDAQSEWIDLGKVTIPANADIPASGTLIEVRYLYAYPNGGALAQPNYLMVRDDLTDAACTIDQLVFKSNDASEDEDA